MRSMKLISSSWLLLLLALFCACSGGRTAENDSELPDTHVETEGSAEKPQILFVNVEVHKDSLRGEETARLHSVMLVDGVLKKSHDGDDIHQGRPQLVCSFLDSEHQPLQRMVVEHPLHRRFESVDEDGALRSTTVELYEGQLALRTQWDSRIRYLRVESVQDSGQPLEIAVLTIQPTAHK